MAHMKGMAAITNPLVNSYKRLVPGYEAPCYMAWSASNRSALIRIPAARGQSTRVAPLREIQPDGSRHPFDQFIVSKTPAGRWGEAEDLGGPAVFLASDASNFVNGLVLYVDGGILAYIGKQPK